MTEAILENARCAIAVDERGAITHLVNKTTGTDHVARPAPPGWKVLTTLGRWTEHPIVPADNRGEISLTETEVVIRYDGLRGVEGATLDVSLEFHFELAHDAEGVRAFLSIANRSNETVTEAWFPYLAGLRDVGGGGTSLVVPVAIARRVTDPATTLPRRFLSAPSSRRATRGLAYPGPASMGWVDVNTATEGLYVASHGNDARRVTLLLKGGEDATFDVAFATHPYVPPGWSFRSDAFAMQPHAGDWRAGAQEYALFASEWSGGHRGAAWLREAPGVRIVFMKHQTGRVYTRYRDLVGVFEALRDRGLSRVPLLVFGWFAGGHDARYPTFEPDDELGGEGELVEALRVISGAGGRVILYANGVLMDCAGAYYTSGPGAGASMKNREGVPYLAEYSYAEESVVYPGKTFALGCPGSRAWRETLVGVLDRVMDLGASGILFDQLGGYEAHLCHDPAHDHATPPEACAAKTDLVRDLRERAAGRDAEFGVMFEMHADRYCPHADLIHSSSYLRDASLAGEPFVEAFRETFPDERFTTRDAWDRSSVNHAFVHGLAFECVGRSGPARMLLERKQGHAFDEDVLERIERMMRLRVKLGAHLLAGRYGGAANVRAEPASAVASAYEAADGTAAIVVWNRDARAGRVALSHARPAATWDAYHLEEDAPVPTGASEGTIEIDVAANDVAVCVERRDG